MKYFQLSSLLLLALILIVGCKKKEGQGDPDYGTSASGLYLGYFMYSGTSIDGTTRVTRESNTTVKMDCNAVDTVFGVFSGVKLSDAGNNSLHVQFDRTNPTLDGTIDKKTLVYIINSGTPVSFTGSKAK